MHPDHAPYFRFTSKARLGKAISSLRGVIEGLTIDNEINEMEITYLSQWLEFHREFADRHPFNEFVPAVEAALKDGVITEEERENILFLCDRMGEGNTNYFDAVTVDIQRLHAIVGAISADRQITIAELRGLSNWVEEHAHLKTCWPYDEIGALVTAVISNEIIDPDKHELLQGFFGEFAQTRSTSRTLLETPPLALQSIEGLCAVQPEVNFNGSTFCFTGASKKYRRADFQRLVSERGGHAVNMVNERLNYLVVAGEGNPCWTYSCYGRKVEQAVVLRKKGARIVLVHEYDFEDAVADS